MTTCSERFLSYDDICKRPAFDQNYEISPDNFQKLIGKYSFKERHICQVRTNKGICRQKHNNGWLGVSLEGVEALIGCDCAVNYFSAHDDFIREKNRINDELDRKEALEKMSSLLEHKLETASYIVDLEKTVKVVEDKLSKIYNTFPNEVLSFLYDAQRTNNWDVFVDVQRFKTVEDENGESFIQESWIKSKLGKISAISPSMDLKRLLDNVTDLRKLYNSFATARPDDLADIKTPKLKKHVKRLGLKDEYAQLIEKYNEEVSAFLKESNMELLIYVCDSNKEQFLTTQALMRLSGLKATHSIYIDKRLKSIKDKMEKLFGGDYIRKSVR